MSELSGWVDQLAAAVGQQLQQRQQRPRATYRLQFNPQGFRFPDALRVAPYLADLGISHIYASPYLKARSGSTHGYDLADHSRLNDELGSAEDYRAFCQALTDRGMSQILDIVPNHMSVATSENHWWQDVLENGPSSPYSRYFDIDWDPVKDELKNAVLLPVLGDQYGNVLEAGQLCLEYKDGCFLLRYYQQTFPIDPRSYTAILSPNLEQLIESLGNESEDLRELQSILTALTYLPERTETTPERVAERQREKKIIQGRIQRLVDSSPPVANFIRRNLEQLNGDPAKPESFDPLDELLSSQSYRLSHWKAASDEINYRRFFDIIELAAICMENEDVFEESHRFIFELLVRGDVSGLRVDHIDGLYDPLEYLWRLQWGYVTALARDDYERLSDENKPAWDQIEPPLLRKLHPMLGGPPPESLFPHRWPTAQAATEPGVPADTQATPNESTEQRGSDESSHSSPPLVAPLYVVVEKILGPEEPLPDEWPVAGTTGYDFLNQVNGMFVDPAGLTETVRNYRRLSDDWTEFREIVFRCKQLILYVAMSNELQLLAQRLNRLSERHRQSRDYTLNTLRRALREILACFPIYRTYIRRGIVVERDRDFLMWATAQAKRRNPATDESVFHFIRDVLLLEQPPHLDDAARQERDFFVGRFQQVTSSVMAKGVEDTAFYRYFPLASLNEVGGDPEHAVLSVEDFHRENRHRRQRWPLSLTCSTTHDTKRSEDVRARINVLSEIPRVWRTAVQRWMKLNQPLRQEVDGQPAPSPNDEYLLYQCLVGIWPLSDAGTDRSQLIERLQNYMEKATHEAKVHTSWINPNPQYDAAVRQFVADILADNPKNRFVRDVQAFHDRIAPWGLYTALSQAFLKLVSAGAPDVYQGQELWDFSLVDPDNRRPVDFDRRRDLLAQLQADVAKGKESQGSLARRLALDPGNDLLKLYTTWRSLCCRRQQASLFQEGEYLPLVAEGAKARSVCAFAWRVSSEGRMAVAIAPRLLAQLCPLTNETHSSPPPLGDAIWDDTTLTLPEGSPARLEDVFTGVLLGVEDGRLRLGDALRDFPVALLVTEPVG